MSTGGEVANALVCKTSIRGFNSRPVLQILFDYFSAIRCLQSFVSLIEQRVCQEPHRVRMSVAAAEQRAN
jgi:hypothetical protein